MSDDVWSVEGLCAGLWGGMTSSAYRNLMAHGRGKLKGLGKRSTHPPSPLHSFRVLSSPLTTGAGVCASLMAPGLDWRHWAVWGGGLIWGK